MLRCTIVTHGNIICDGNIVYLTVLLIQQAFVLMALAGLFLFFKPLLVGMARALLLVLRPRLSREERAARAKLRDRRTLEKMINASSGPSHAAELQALAARS
jgi:hypothetical protein